MIFCREQCPAAFFLRVLCPKMMSLPVKLDTSDFCGSHGSSARVLQAGNYSEIVLPKVWPWPNLGDYCSLVFTLTTGVWSILCANFVCFHGPIKHTQGLLIAESCALARRRCCTRGYGDEA